MNWHYEKCAVCGRVFMTKNKGQYHCSLACKEKKDRNFQQLIEQFRKMEGKQNERN